MKNQFESLDDFAVKIEHIEKTKNDYLVPYSSIRFTDDQLVIDKEGEFGINEHCHGQIADRCGIPRRYYSEMGKIPGLRALNVNAWSKEKEEKRLVRTLEETARAYLSDSFKPLDNYDVLNQAVFPALLPMKEELKVKATTLSPTRMYIQFTIQNLVEEVKKGDLVAYGITISNSEVGAGSLNAESWIERYACSNGMVRKSLFKKYHVGRRIQEGDDNYHIWQNDTLKKELETYQLQLRDVIAHAMTGEDFRKEVALMKAAVSDTVQNVVDTVQNVTKRFGLSDNEGKSIIQNMTEFGDISRWGVANGITALAHQMENPDRQYQYEKLGSQVIDLSPKDWSLINA